MNWYKIAQNKLNFFQDPDGVKQAFKEMEGFDISEAHGWSRFQKHLDIYNSEGLD